MGIVHDTVADGVGDCRVPQRRVPSFRGELGGDYGRGSPVTVLKHLEQISALLVGLSFTPADGHPK